MPYRVTKRYGHGNGFSCAFRQWRADSHCSFIHGYALAFDIVFEADQLDDRNWVIDFGGLKEVKQQIVDTFDHKTVVATDDPQIELYETLDWREVIDLVQMPVVGCEAFAEHVYNICKCWLDKHSLGDRCRVVSVTCHEHESNSATYTGDQ